MDCLSHFGLKLAPFSTTPDPRFAYATREHRQALSKIAYYTEECRGIFLLTGAIGTGKTTISPLALNGWRDQPEKFLAIHITDPSPRTEAAFLRLLAAGTDWHRLFLAAALANLLLLAATVSAQAAPSATVSAQAVPSKITALMPRADSRFLSLPRHRVVERPAALKAGSRPACHYGSALITVVDHDAPLLFLPAFSGS